MKSVLKKGTVVTTITEEYRVEKQISQGGNGTVFQVRNSLNEVFALKAIDRQRISRDKLKRFRNELHFCENHSHKNIIQVIDSGTYTESNKQIVFYIMPLYSGTLNSEINKGIPHDKVLPLFSQLLNAVKFAHGKNIWHRDLKPENILIDSEGNVVLADFGIAHFCEEELVTVIETKPTDKMANFQYASPEQRTKGAIVDHRADIYALGLILNEMFTKTVIAGSGYKRIASVAKEYAFLDEIIDLMITQDPNDRISSIEDITIRIAAAQDFEKRNSELLELAKPHNEVDEGFKPIEVPTFTLEYKDGKLWFHLKDFNSYYIELWFDVLRAGKYNHSFHIDYNCINLNKIGTSIVMPIRGYENAETVKSVATNVKNWFKSATDDFNRTMIAEEKQRKLNNERELAAKIEKLRKEQEYQRIVNSIMFD